MSTASVILAAVSGLNTLLAGSIWFKLGVLQGKIDAGAAPTADRFASIESRLASLEGRQ